MSKQTISPLLLAQKIKAKEIGVVELIKDRLQKQAADDNNRSDCFISVRAEQALAEAEQIQKRINDGECVSPLAGIPVSVDDTILIKNELSTAASKMLHNFKSPFGATVVDKMTEAGMIIVGKTNTSEFGIGTVSNNTIGVTTKNPYAEDTLAAGGAVAVATGISDFSFGSDANGLPRTLAAEAGVCFIKPTYGTVSRFGLVANASSMEQIGVYAKTIESGFAALSLIAGHDANDGTSYPNPSYTYAAAHTDLQSVRIAILGDCMNETDAETQQATQAFIKKLEAAGATVSSVAYPLLQVVPQVSFILSAAEASNNISRFDGIKFGYRPTSFRGVNDLYLKARTESFGLETKLAAMVGGLVLTSDFYDDYYFKSMQIRRLLKQELDTIFAQYDAVLLPTTNDFGHTGSFERAYANLKYTALANLTGVPAISLCCDATADRPVGVQLMAKSFNENILLQIGKCMQTGGDGDEV